MTGPVVTLDRAPEFDESTFGLLQAPGGFLAVTVELPWRDNHHDISCIVAGDHQCWWGKSPRHGMGVYHVKADGRAGIEIEPAANFASDLLGCISLGRKIARFPNGKYGVAYSGSTRRRFVRHMGRRPFVLRINPPPA